MNTINQTVALFFPPAPKDSEVTFDSALNDLATQRIARIAKTVFFVIASVAATAAITLTEAGLLTWPLAIPAILTTLVAGLIFYRLNSLDSTYIERLTDPVKESCVKKELERIFFSQESLTQEEIQKSLNGVNRLLAFEVFEQPAIERILSVHRNAGAKSIAEAAVEQNQSLGVNLGSKWTEQGRFGLPSYELDVGVSWTGNPSDSIVVKYVSKEVKNDASVPEMD
jgi:hypothetical protein